MFKTYDSFKKEVFRLAKAQKKNHLIPSNDYLFTYFQGGLTPAAVVEKYCTLAASRIRHQQG